MKSFKQYLNESELEAYRKEALHHIKHIAKDWSAMASKHLGTKVHHMTAHGSVKHKNKFKEDSDIDVAFHTVDKSRPKGFDEQRSYELQDQRGAYFHHHLGNPDLHVYNHHDHKDIPR